MVTNGYKRVRGQSGVGRVVVGSTKWRGRCGVKVASAVSMNEGSSLRYLDSYQKSLSIFLPVDSYFKYPSSPDWVQKSRLGSK